MHESKRLHFSPLVGFLVVLGVSATAAAVIQQKLLDTYDTVSLTAAVVQSLPQAPTDPQDYVKGQILVQFKLGVSKATHDKDLSANGASVKKTIPQIRTEIISV